MSARSADGFRPTLRALERELPLPIPDRVRILRELEFDLEELRARFVAEGSTPDEARARAVAALVPDRETLRELSRLHEPLYRRITRGLSERWLRRMERGALVGATLGVLSVGAWGLARADLLADASGFLWPVLAVGALLFAVVAYVVFRLWIKSDHTTPHRGLDAIPALCAVAVATALCGTLIELGLLATELERDPSGAVDAVLGWLLRDATLMCVALLIAMAGGLAWFALSQWVASVTGARRDVLGTAPAMRNQLTMEMSK